MDAECVLKTWSELPECMVEEILKWLPLKRSFGFRSVCKEWKDLLSHSTFLNQWIQARNRYPQLLLHNTFNNGIFSFCTLSGIWNKIIPSTSPSPSSIHDFVQGAGAVAGLVLLQKPTGSNCNRKSLLVCNPLMQTTFELPPMLGISHILAKCIVRQRVLSGEETETRESYKVVAMAVVVGTNKFKNTNTIETYNFSQRSWKIAADHLPEMYSQIYSGNSVNMVFCHGFFFCIRRSAHKNTGVIIFSIQNYTRPSFVALPMDGNGMGETHLVKSRDSVLIVAEVEMEKEKERNIIVWQLQIVEKMKPEFWKWKEITKIPRPVLKEFEESYIKDGRRAKGWFDCVGSAEHIFLRRARRSRKVVAYNLQQGYWRSLPLCPDESTDVWFNMSSV